MTKNNQADFEIPDWMKNVSQEDMDGTLEIEDLDTNDLVERGRSLSEDKFILNMLFVIPLHLIFWAIVTSVLLWAFTLIIDSVHFDWRFVGIISVIAAIITSWIMDRE